MNNSYNVVKYLIENEFKIDIENQQKQTPLHIACEKENIKIVEILIDKGAYINSEMFNGKTPLHIASEKTK